MVVGQLELIEILKFDRFKFLTFELLFFVTSKFYETSYGPQVDDFHQIYVFIFLK